MCICVLPYTLYDYADKLEFPHVEMTNILYTILLGLLQCPIIHNLPFARICASIWVSTKTKKMLKHSFCGIKLMVK